jgi:hypothetical protein
MESAYQQQEQLLRQPAPPSPDDLSPPHYGSLPLALLQHPSTQLAALALALLLALSGVAPVAGAAAALAVSLFSALLAFTTHMAYQPSGRSSSGGSRTRASTTRRAHGPGPLCAISLDLALAIAAASWLAVWAWADPPGAAFWLQWQPTLVLALLSLELITAALVGMPCAYPLLVDKAPPLLMRMDLPDRPALAGGSPSSSPPWLRALSRDVTLAWGLLAGLAAASCAVPAASSRHAFPGDAGQASSGGGGGAVGELASALLLFAAAAGKHDGGSGGGIVVDPSAPADPVDVAMSVCVPFALGIIAMSVGDALCERARRAQLPRLMAAAAALAGGGGAAGAGGGGGGLEASAAPPSGVLVSADV